MFYYDIHTHQQTNHPEEISIFSFDVRNPFTPDNRLSYAFGVHPWYINADDPDTANRLLSCVGELAILSEAVAIGETGLDKVTAKTSADFQLQQSLFVSHARLSEELKKPLIIHCVKAYNDILRFHNSIKPAMPWIIHGFRGKEALASQLLHAGFYLSFGRYYDRGALKAAWANHRLLVETDDCQINIRDIYHLVANDLNIPEFEISDSMQVFRRFCPA